MSFDTRWLLTGSGGQLATAFERILDGEVFLVREDFLDLRDAEAVKATVRGFGPDVIVHCAAYTNVDGAETEEETAFAVNALGTRNLVEAIRGTHTQIVSFSSDYVFDGAKREPYVESDEPNPLGAYGRTKLAQEREVLNWVHGTIVRTAWLFSADGHNFVKTILAAARERAAADPDHPEPLRVVDDQTGSPTYAGHLAEALLDAVRRGLGSGIYHFAGGGQCTWCELAREVVAVAGLPVEVLPITTAEAGRPAPRPPFSALVSERDIPWLPDWPDGVRAAVEELLERT